MDIFPTGIITWSWLAFFIFWVVTMLWSKTPLKRDPLSNRIGYMALLIVGFFLLFDVGDLASVYPLSLRIIPDLAYVRIVADGIAVAGAALAIWSRVSLGANWSGTVQLKEGHELVMKGPYAYVRHPIYTAILMLFIATGLAFGTLAAFVGFPFVFLSFWIKLRQEERVMLAEFPTEYPLYAARVKRLVPFIL